MSCCCFAVISTAEVGVIQRFGKFSRFAEPGCFFICCPIELVTGRVSLRVQELNVELETKTKDNVFVKVHSSVQYQVIRDKVYFAFYSLTNVKMQLEAYVFDTLRSALCDLTVDEAFESKDNIALELKKHLTEVMSNYGISIATALVTDLSPDSRVRDAMNDINAAKRLKESAYARAEGEKILKVKRAEAEAESMYLSGMGVARQRKAIMLGLKDSIVDFSHSVSGASAKDVMDLLILNQYFDTLQQVGQGGGKVVFLSENRDFTTSIMQANAGH